MTLKDFDKPYLNNINSSFSKLEIVYKDIQNNYEFDLNKTEISEAILMRLKAYYLTQGKIKSFLDKRYIAAASDFFVESTLFFLKLYFQANGQKLEAHSERQIKKRKNAIRPDISIWKDDQVIAIIECKTQLGWNRKNWEKEFTERELKLKNDYPKAKTFLLVMTGENWGGFGSHKDLKSKYFCLLNDIWPGDFFSTDQIFTPIEGLFKQLK